MCVLLYLIRSTNEAKMGIQNNFSMKIFTEDIPNCDSVCEYKTKPDISSSWLAERQAVCRVMEMGDIRREWRGDIVRFMSIEYIFVWHAHMWLLHVIYRKHCGTRLTHKLKQQKRGNIFHKWLKIISGHCISIYFQAKYYYTN